MLCLAFLAETIAFITGIYDDLLASINAFNLNTLKQLKTDGVKGVWKTINGNFLLALFSGIALSFLSLAKVFKYLLENHPNMVWGFFFGLVLGSIYLVSKMIATWDWQAFVAVLVGYCGELLFNNNSTRRRSKRMVVYFYKRGNCHLCNDFTRCFRIIYTFNFRGCIILCWMPCHPWT